MPAPHPQRVLPHILCVRILLYTKLRNAGPSSATRTPTYFMCPHSALYLESAYSYTCVRILRILLYMCPHTLHISRPHTPIHVSAYYYVCVRILLCMCVRILLHMCPHTTSLRRCPPYADACIRQHTSAYVSIRQHMCPHTTSLRRCPPLGPSTAALTPIYLASAC